MGACKVAIFLPAKLSTNYAFMRVDRIRGMLRKCEQLKTTRGVEKKRMCRAVCFLFLFPRPPLDHLRHLWSSSVPHRFVLSLERERELFFRRGARRLEQTSRKGETQPACRSTPMYTLMHVFVDVRVYSGISPIFYVYSYESLIFLFALTELRKTTVNIQKRSFCVKRECLGGNVS